jgi:hypothetical protein
MVASTSLGHMIIPLYISKRTMESKASSKLHQNSRFPVEWVKVPANIMYIPKTFIIVRFNVNKFQSEAHPLLPQR